MNVPIVIITSNDIVLERNNTLFAKTPKAYIKLCKTLLDCCIRHHTHDNGKVDIEDSFIVTEGTTTDGPIITIGFESSVKFVTI